MKGDAIEQRPKKDTISSNNGINNDDDDDDDDDDEDLRGGRSTSQVSTTHLFDVLSKSAWGSMSYALSHVSNGLYI